MHVSSRAGTIAKYVLLIEWAIFPGSMISLFAYDKIKEAENLRTARIATRTIRESNGAAESIVDIMAREYTKGRLEPPYNKMLDHRDDLAAYASKVVELNPNKGLRLKLVNLHEARIECLRPGMQIQIPVYEYTPPNNSF